MKKWFVFKKQSIPNYLTCLRIIVVPIIITLLLVNSATLYNFHLWNNNLFIDINITTLVAGILFILASLSDALDGYLARKYQWISEFGKFWDPLADKILVNAVLFCLASPQQNLLPIWIPIIILIRDIIIDGFRLNMKKNNVVVSANIYGKIKTICLMIGIIYLIFLGNPIWNVGNLYYWLIQNMLMYWATILCIVSGIIYISPVIKQNFEKKEEL